MADAFILRAGGGGALSVNAAILHVNAPLGSTITFSKGGVVAKTIDSSKAHPNDDGASADYYYSISTSNYGEWTVEGSLNGDTASETVSISAAKQYDITLSYSLWLVKDGKMMVPFSGDGSVSEVTSTLDYVKFETGHAAWMGYLYPDDPINPSEYKTLIFDCLQINVGYGTSVIGLYAGKNGESALATRSFGASTTQRTQIALDISEITVTAAYPSTGIKAGNFCVRNLYLARE